MEVARRPRLVTIATGDELRAVGEAVDDQYIPYSVALGLTALLGAMGAEALGHHLLGDDLTKLEAAAADAVAIADLVVVTGGASVGAHDHAKAMFAPLGMQLLFSKVAIKPGKPVWLGGLARHWSLDSPVIPAPPWLRRACCLPP